MTATQTADLARFADILTLALTSPRARCDRAAVRDRLRAALVSLDGADGGGAVEKIRRAGWAALGQSQSPDPA